MNSSVKQWNAKWIWGGTEASPRNEWRCFRKTFTLPADWSTGELSITADSRYVLYVNGERVGRGPCRSWPKEQSYDSYDIGHLLRPGKPNTIAVLVLHFGVSTFYYVRGRGGLIAELNLYNGEERVGQVATDGSWRTSLHLARDPRVQRMSCQQAFAERIDARLWDERWVEPDYNDADWESASVVGNAGIAPWDRLVPRTIPLLTEEKIYPSRVESLSRVVPVPWTACIELRNQMIPGSEDNANAYHYAGYVGTVIRTDKETEATIGFPFAPSLWQGIILNGVRYPKGVFTSFHSQKYLQVKLNAGDNLLLVAFAGSDHGRGLFMGIDCDQAFQLVSPIDADGEQMSPFISVGPFVSFEYIDHQYGKEERAKQRIIDLCAKFDAALPDADAAAAEIVTAFRSAGQAAGRKELEPHKSVIRPIPNVFVSKESVLALSIWKRESRPLPVPAALQRAVTANAHPAAVPVYETGDTEIIIDFGRQGSGYITFELSAEAGTIVDFYGFEHMRDGWIQHMHYLENSLRYICREGRQRYTSPIRRGFRYLMVTIRGARKPVQLYGVQLLQSNYPVAEIGQFQCSDSMLNEIWRISRLTTKLCMEDTFVDCPTFEQTFWVGDSRNEALISYYLFGAESLVKRCLELVPGSRDQTPLYADQVPSGWSSVIPNWTFFWVVACAEYYERTGDLSFAREMWPHVAYTLDHYLQLLDDRGLLSLDAWNFLDWAPIDQPREGVVSHQNMFLVRALRCAAALARLAEDEGKRAGYEAAAGKLTAAINEHLWCDEKQAYLDCIHHDGRRSSVYSMQTQVVALLCGIAEGGRKERLLGYLLTPPADFVPIGSPFMSFFHYEALAQAGLYQQMIDDMRRQYGQMVDYGATTCWEMYPKMKDGRINPHNLTRSHCHAWSAAPGYFLGAFVLGVRPASAGWRKVTVEPRVCGLAWARGSVPLPDEGRIDVAWTLDSGRLKLTIWAPANVEVDARLPEGTDGEIELIRLGE